MSRAGYDIEASACILVQTIEPQARGLDHGHIVGGRALDPAGSSRSRALMTSWLHETVECLCSMAHPLVPSTHNQNRVVGLRDHSVSR